MAMICARRVPPSAARIAHAIGYPVAVKLLSDEDPSEDVLGRFRDEARILGFVTEPQVIRRISPTSSGAGWTPGPDRGRQRRRPRADRRASAR